MPDNAPIMFKSPQAAGLLIDGVEQSVLCELADKAGTYYLASDVDEAEAIELEEKRVFLNLLNVEGAVCGRVTETLDLPFVSDPQRLLVSTWGEFPSEENGDVWGSCIADTSRKAGDRVVYCEVSAVQEEQVLETPMPEAIETDTPAPDAELTKPGSKPGPAY